MKTFVAMVVGGLALFIAQGCKASEPQKPAPARQKSAEHAHQHHVASRIEVEVTEKGYTPSVIEAKAGEPLTLVFKRTTDKGCGQELVFPDLDIRRPLPLNQEVEIVVTPKKGQSIPFTCGMNMYRGRVEAR